MSRIGRRIDKLAARLNWLLPEGTVIVGGLKGMFHDIRRLREDMCGVKSRIDKVVVAHGDLGYEVDKWCRYVSVLKTRIDEFENRITKPATVECETCGCLLNKGTAVRGESVIEPLHEVLCDIHMVIQESPKLVGETIREVYYCKVHQPTDKGATKVKK